MRISQGEIGRTLRDRERYVTVVNDEDPATGRVPLVDAVETANLAVIAAVVDLGPDLHAPRDDSLPPRRTTGWQAALQSSEPAAICPLLLEVRNLTADDFWRCAHEAVQGLRGRPELEAILTIVCTKGKIPRGAIDPDWHEPPPPGHGPRGRVR